MPHFRLTFVAQKRLCLSSLIIMLLPLRDGPLEKLWGGEGGGEVPKKYSRKGKLNEKNSCTLIDSKKYSCYGLQKIHTRNLITKKNSCGSKIALPPPPITFLMVRPLCDAALKHRIRKRKQKRNTESNINDRYCII